MVYEIRDPRPLMPLFGPWEETMLYSCFQGVMGKLYADSSLAPRWALAELGDFAFLAGVPCEEAVRHPLFSRAFCILTPQSEAWSQAIETVWGRQARAVRSADAADSASSQPEWDRKRSRSAVFPVTRSAHISAALSLLSVEMRRMPSAIR